MIFMQIQRINKEVFFLFILILFYIIFIKKIKFQNTVKTMQ